MKARVKFLLVLVSISILSCKNEKSVDDLKVETPQVVESKVKVTIDMVVKTDDTFQLFYTEDGTLNFNDKFSVRTPVKGSENSQKVVFELPEDVKFTFLRIDMGENNKQSEIKINNFLVNYFDKKWEAKGNLFFQFFGPNDQMTLNYDLSTLTPVVKEGVVYDPILYPMEPVGVELQKLLK
ncbi:hypothetical protein [Flavobacterium koreense]